MKLRAVFSCVLLLGCTYGGSSEDPSMGLAPDDSEQPLIDAAMSSGDEPPPTPSVTPAKTGGGGSDAGKAPVTGGVDAGKINPSAPASACAPMIATCDPVRNTGCPPLMQCDIDTSASTPTGRCVFGNVTPGVACMSSFVNVSCPAQTTCVAGACRKMCYCDSDCAAGQTCSDASGPGPAGAFKLCQ